MNVEASTGSSKVSRNRLPGCEPAPYAMWTEASRGPAPSFSMPSTDTAESAALFTPWTLVHAPWSASSVALEYPFAVFFCARDRGSTTLEAAEDGIAPDGERLLVDSGKGLPDTSILLAPLPSFTAIFEASNADRSTWPSK